MSPIKRFLPVLVAGLLLSSAVSAQTVPATGPATTKAVVTPEAKKELEQLSAAYSGLNSLELGGSVRGHFEFAGQKQDKEGGFTASFEKPNKFHQEMKEDGMLAGSTGDKVFIYAKEPNVYRLDDAPKGKLGGEAEPSQTYRIVGQQNPSLILALSEDPAAALQRGLPAAEVLPPVKVDDKSFTALQLSNPADGSKLTLLLDPQTHLIRRATLDLSASLTAQGAPDVKAAEVIVDYTKVVANAPVKPEQFAWTPPADAKDAAKEPPPGAGDDQAAMELVGKPAPTFALKDMKDEEISLAKLKGKVVIVDFWATWCGPCRQGLPHVQKVYEDLKGQGVEAVAVNIKEPKDTVRKFVEEIKLSVPVALDADAAVAGAYRVNGIPQTVVIGRDGSVKKVLIGTGPDSESQLRAAVEAAAKEKE